MKSSGVTPSCFDQTAHSLTEQTKMAAAKSYFAWQARLVRPYLGRCVVEVGCGIGNFTQFLLDRDAVHAVDVDPSCLQQVKARYPGQTNLFLHLSDPADPSFGDFIRYEPNSCVCLNVLEHIKQDKRAIRAMASILAPGGTVVLLLPAFPSLYGPTDRALAHFRRYTPQSVIQLAAEVGLRIEKLHYLNLVGFFGWWANAHLFRRSTLSSLQIKLFDRYIVPVMSRLEGFVSPPFGQSLFAVLRKPGP